MLSHSIRPLSLRSLSLIVASCAAFLLADCVRIDSNGNPVNQPKPVVGTHVAPPARP